MRSRTLRPARAPFLGLVLEEDVRRVYWETRLWKENDADNGGEELVKRRAVDVKRVSMIDLASFYQRVCPKACLHYMIVSKQ